VSEQFRDYWLAKSGADACKADWEATWRNWVRRERERPIVGMPLGKAQPVLNRQEALEARNRQVAASWAAGAT